MGSLNVPLPKFCFFLSSLLTRYVSIEGLIALADFNLLIIYTHRFKCSPQHNALKQLACPSGTVQTKSHTVAYEKQKNLFTNFTLFN
jgi:hypothetical protein